jgi:hypothetical protein
MGIESACTTSIYCHKQQFKKSSLLHLDTLDDDLPLSRHANENHLLHGERRKLARLTRRGWYFQAMPQPTKALKRQSKGLRIASHKAHLCATRTDR